MSGGSFWMDIREGSRFFHGEGAVQETLKRLAERLREECLDYALVGGLALVAHGNRRFTEDVDILMRPETIERFRQACVGRGYLPAFPGAERSFRDTETQVRIEVLPTGAYPGDGKPKPVAFPDPVDVREDRAGIWVVRLDTLVSLKLASGLSAPHRLRDLSDVQDLIARAGLPRELADRLDSSVRPEYLRLWDQVDAAR